MPVHVRSARALPIAVSTACATARLGAALLFFFAGSDALQTAVAEGDTRTISMHHIHTDEKITITYKRNGRYDDEALKKLNWFLRDWRREQATTMDPHLIDLLWETNRSVGGKEPIDIICGYRSPETNSMLRARSSGVAQFSQHINGNAIDFYIPGVPLADVRAVGLRLQRGGVGFYPTSGSPFVHMDTGTIRHWPRISHEELAKIFPDGRTVHIPSDGHPLPGYALALADIEKRGDIPSDTSLETARSAGVITARDEARAADQHQKRAVLARLPGAGRDEDDESERDAPKQAREAARPATPAAVASLTPPKRVAVERIVPMPQTRPKPVEVAAVVPKQKPAERPVIVAAAQPVAATPASNNVFDSRGYWRGAIETVSAQPARAASPFETASAEPASTGSTGQDALAYAPETTDTPAARARPMGTQLQQLPMATQVIPASPNTTVMVKPPLAAAVTQISGTLADPWLRAALLTPSVHNTLTVTQSGPRDSRPLQSLFYKPSQLLVMTFSADPHLGMADDRFSGSAVVFLATATFRTQQTASLR